MQDQISFLSYRIVFITRNEGFEGTMDRKWPFTEEKNVKVLIILTLTFFHTLYIVSSYWFSLKNLQL